MRKGSSNNMFGTGGKISSIDSAGMNPYECQHRDMK